MEIQRQGAATPEGQGVVQGEWSDEELRASVAAYLRMQRSQRDGQGFSKSKVYADLARRFGRSSKAYEYRMQNISYVLTLMGRDWLSGLKPARNVGAQVAERIEKILGEIEGLPATSTAGFERAVRSARGRMAGPPSGRRTPTKSIQSIAQFQRDPSVKAWVLDQARGICECCGQPAPFQNSDDQPFLEVHHVRQLADEGSDRVENAVALCPNCHRALHFSRDAKALVERLYGQVGRLVRE